MGFFENLFSGRSSQKETAPARKEIGPALFPEEARTIEDQALTAFFAQVERQGFTADVADLLSASTGYFVDSGRVAKEPEQTAQPQA
ncbi:hypothetical protein A2533_03660 [Candidatus Falkowbacteria bacterium RIFOXYD2_FULL_35_9]|uniref:Uncharacterized protein n=1 Tax=Candidatus Falkowbacteria bacterium RIFOXYC2_FULL_36_12 TaxID=1798002 RepID=A0A1F5SYF2_9BACT|nr:MAG: hypothetical protein A2478_04300 [Candidatus Falkowbacteria bacterium RIFOXYC2_FULL_36_12]OGF33806.1 MAG: hypothetical protein A2223_03745 [Candidatus Falkowbacteria bacterium RIFOXYA2_FULL_35_8]OGF45929.1 MAG: hypothetical protein A2533_03660 [Candidatus Falkowbacteria bacterium RIFOXYD2_FULL_35_9]